MYVCLGSGGGGEVVREPVETLVEALAAGGDGALDLPLAASHVVEAQLLCDLCDGQRLGQILLVGEDEQRSVPEKGFVEENVEFTLGLLDSSVIVGIHDVDDTASVLIIETPQLPDLRKEFRIELN